MLTLTEANELFARLDATPSDQIESQDKALRNISQRLYLPPDDMRGRVFLYTDASIVALRLLYLGSAFGLNRVRAEDYARWLRGAGTRRRAVDGGFMSLSICEEAIERAQAGETFNFHVILSEDGRCRMAADWQRDESIEPFEGKIDRKKIASTIEAAGLSHRPEIGRYSVPASKIIFALLNVLPKAD